MNITRLYPDTLNELGRLSALGITSLKVFTAYNNRLRLADGDIFRLLRAAREYGYLTLLHAENGDVIEELVAEALAAKQIAPVWHARTRPAWGAVEAALRGAALAAQAGAPLYIVHMNTGGEADMLAYARERGAPVMGETCPQYLFFSEADLERPDGAKWVCSPPVRQQSDQERLWKALAEGTIQVIATDHCPFFFDGSRSIQYEGSPVAIPGKELGRKNFTQIPNGLPGVGDRLPVLWTRAVRAGHLTPNQFVALNATNPAKIFGLYPRKGTLAPGADADILIWNKEKKVLYGVDQAQHRTDYNLYQDWELTGYPEMVFLRGQCLVGNGRWLGQAGAGRFLKRSPFAEIL
jgi:dihydropyrimidinase